MSIGATITGRATLGPAPGRAVRAPGAIEPPPRGDIAAGPPEGRPPLEPAAIAAGTAVARTAPSARATGSRRMILLIEVSPLPPPEAGGDAGSLMQLTYRAVGSLRGQPGGPDSEKIDPLPRQPACRAVAGEGHMSPSAACLARRGRRVDPSLLR